MLLLNPENRVKNVSIYCARAFDPKSLTLDFTAFSS